MNLNLKIYIIKQDIIETPDQSAVAVFNTMSLIYYEELPNMVAEKFSVIHSYFI
jgi:hypothetical protein